MQLQHTAACVLYSGAVIQLQVQRRDAGLFFVDSEQPDLDLQMPTPRMDSMNSEQ